MPSTPPPDAVGIPAAGGRPSPEDPALVSEMQRLTLSEAPGQASQGPAPGPCLQRLTISREPGDRVPAYKRQLLASLLFGEYVKFTPCEQEAREKAQAKERAAFEGSAGKAAYARAAQRILSELQGLAPSLVPGLSRAALWGQLRGALLSESERRVHGYPFPDPRTPGGARVFPFPEEPQGARRLCSRCGRQFDLSIYSGQGARGEAACHYHWGKAFRSRGPGPKVRLYSCCYSALGTRGCKVAEHHVHDGRKENLQGFVQTAAKPGREGAHPGFYALDCEMSYTTHGLELTRVTVVDADMRLVYDTFVRPEHRVVDYNTRFSGITEAHLASAGATLRDVQAVLLHLFNADTVLVGHSLECDLLALRMIHATVVDTAVLFSTRLGSPYKRSLSSLAARYLGRTIQKTLDGHNSGEDARACMGLVLWKIQSDAGTARDSAWLPPEDAD